MKTPYKILVIVLASIAAFTIIMCNENNETKEQRILEQARFDKERMISMSNDKYFIKGKRQLETMGYTNILPMSYPLFCCSESDSFFFSVGFTAKTQNGEVVKGCFCVPRGVFKNAVTIRFE